MQDAQTKKHRRHFIASSLALGLSTLASGVQAQARPAKHVLVVGDSLSAEYGLARGTGWVALLAQRLAQHQQPVQVTTQVLARLERLQKEMDALLERWAELEG